MSESFIASRARLLAEWDSGDPQKEEAAIEVGKRLLPTIKKRLRWAAGNWGRISSHFELGFELADGSLDGQIIESMANRVMHDLYTKEFFNLPTGGKGNAYARLVAKMGDNDWPDGICVSWLLGLAEEKDPNRSIWLLISQWSAPFAEERRNYTTFGARQMAIQGKGPVSAETITGQGAVGTVSEGHSKKKPSLTVEERELYAQHQEKLDRRTSAPQKPSASLSPVEQEIHTREHTAEIESSASKLVTIIQDKLDDREKKLLKGFVEGSTNLLNRSAIERLPSDRKAEEEELLKCLVVSEIQRMFAVNRAEAEKIRSQFVSKLLSLFTSLDDEMLRHFREQLFESLESNERPTH